MVRFYGFFVTFHILLVQQVTAFVRAPFVSSPDEAKQPVAISGRAITTNNEVGHDGLKRREVVSKTTAFALFSQLLTPTSTWAAEGGIGTSPRQAHCCSWRRGSGGGALQSDSG